MSNNASINKIIAATFDGRTREEFNAIMKEGERIQRDESGCSGCTHWRNGGNAKCSKWDAVPPEEVQAVGCEDWRYDDIPF